MYIIARCPSCGKLMMANTANRTRSCPNCGFRANLFNLKILARAQSSQEAVEVIQHLKEKQGNPSGEVTFKRFKR
ncbi:MAG: DUF1922 domain-containing protein [Candidatus Bathyarchaeota archaeon]|nr:DUF1922 domain-containing protein [Candidatus Bathyarchaeota archaeon]